MKIIETKGNYDLMNREKILFLCSKKTPVHLYKYIFQWTDSLKSSDCIVCFNSTDMESEVLKALLVNRIPTILFVVNRFTDTNNVQIIRALKENRLLIVVLRRDEPMGYGLTPTLRNQYVISICQHIVCGYINKTGSIFPLLVRQKDIHYLINNCSDLMVADSPMHYERWTVAEDKILLRMYYDDMGIHVIHQRLKRSYEAVYNRIRSITQPEELIKGREFEDYVLSLFNLQKRGDLSLQEWQGDKTYGMIQPENNSNPDFVFRYKETEFAIECKWREMLSSDLGRTLFLPRNITNYKRFSVSRNMPVTIILGVGGEPSVPELLYIIPLNRLSAIVSHKTSIIEFLHTSHKLEISMFLSPFETKKTKYYTIEEKRKTYANAYKPWNREDDELLISLYNQGKSITELALIFKRNKGAICSRIKKVLRHNI